MTQRAPRRERGFALLIVLWTTSLLALIGAQVTGAGRTEARLAANLRGEAIAEAAADAGVQEAALRLIQAGIGTPTFAARYVLRLPQAAVEVTVENEGARLPLNTAPLPLLAAVLRRLGVEPGQSETMAARIADWRSPAPFPLKGGAKAPQYRAAGLAFGPPDRPFKSASELSMVLGMTPELLTRLAPHVTAYTQSAPRAQLADPLVLSAMQEVAAGGVQPLSFDELPIYRVTAVGRAAGGGEFIRRAVLRLGVAGDAGIPDRAFDVLGWFEGAPGAIPD